MSVEAKLPKFAGDKDEIKKNNDAEVSKFLRGIGMEMYIDTFMKQDIDMNSLLQLDDDHFKELGISVGHRLKLKQAIEDLKSSSNAEEHMEYNCKVIVVGHPGAGKTALIQRYTNGVFDKNYKTTIGVDFCMRELQWSRNTTVSVQLWDIAGQDRFTNLTRMYYREARGAFVVFDLMREKSFEEVLKWKADIDAKVTLPSGAAIPVVLLANKCDLIDKQIDLDEFCKTHGFQKWFLTSAKEDVGINDACKYLVSRILEDLEGYAKPAEEEERGAIHVMGKTNTPAKTSKCCS